MADHIHLNWQWPAGRAVEQTLLINIESIAKYSPLISRIRNSPSLAEAIPDRYIIKGIEIKDAINQKNLSLSLVLPLLEIDGLKAGGNAKLGIVDGNICICISPLGSSEKSKCDTY